MVVVVVGIERPGNPVVVTAVAAAVLVQNSCSRSGVGANGSIRGDRNGSTSTRSYGRCSGLVVVVVE